MLPFSNCCTQKRRKLLLQSNVMEKCQVAHLQLLLNSSDIIADQRELQYVQVHFQPMENLCDSHNQVSRLTPTVLEGALL